MCAYRLASAHVCVETLLSSPTQLISCSSCPWVAQPSHPRFDYPYLYTSSIRIFLRFIYFFCFAFSESSSPFARPSRLSNASLLYIHAERPIYAHINLALKSICRSSISSARTSSSPLAPQASRMGVVVATATASAIA